jgi:lipopolysaccharide export system protein LptA
MLSKVISLKIALQISAFFLFSQIVVAQKNVLQLLPGSEKLGYNQKTGAHRLIGSVNFTYQGNTMYCDSAHYMDKIAEVRAYGNVHITKGEINLYCDSLFYNGKTRKAKLWGNVRVRDAEYKLSTDTLEYDAKKTQGTYLHGGRIESSVSQEVLTSKIGQFHPYTRDFFCSGDVRYKKESTTMSTDTLQFNYAKQIMYFFGPTNVNKDSTQLYCERGWYALETDEAQLIQHAKIQEPGKMLSGDFLHYNPKEGQSIGKGHVYYSNSSESMAFFGDYAKESKRTQQLLLTGHALAVLYQKNDTIYIHADTLLQQNDSLGKKKYTNGFAHVRVLNKSIQSISDSLHMDHALNQLELHKKPIVWAQNAELKGKEMTIYFTDTLLEKIHIRQDASAVMELDSGKIYNQIAGKEITAFFTNNRLKRSEVSGNAQTIFFPENEEKTDTLITLKRLGMNRILASDLRIYLDSGEVTGITYFDKPDGVFYPMDKIQKEVQFIPSFNWNPSLRPKNWMEIIHE